MFAMGIIGGLDGTNAAIKAGYVENSAHVHAHRMLNDDKFKHIQQFINLKQEAVVKKYAYDHERHIESTVRQAQANTRCIGGILLF